MLKAYTVLVLLFLAFTFVSCSKSCEECSDDFSLRFRIQNTEGEELIDEVNGLSLVTLDGNSLEIEREETETDSVFYTSMDMEIRSSEVSDTVIFFYNDAIIDSASVTYGFKRDSECCTNPRQVENMATLNLQSIKLIKREFNVYTIVVE